MNGGDPPVGGGRAFGPAGWPHWESFWHMHDGEVIFEVDKLQALFRRLAEEGCLVEVRFEGDEQLYGATLLDVGGGGKVPGESGLLISPLEPPAGNMRIRRGGAIQAGISDGGFFLEFKLAFQKVMMVEGGQGILIAMPRVVQVHLRRKQERLPVPPDWSMMVALEKKGSSTVNAEVVDLSEGGLSFICSANQCPLAKGDRLKITISGARRYVPSLILLSGEICYHARARSSENLAEALDRYGIRFMGLTHTQEMQVTRLLRTVQMRGGRG